MRYKDISTPLYEAVRYGNKEKSYVLSNLNKFNFGVELEFDLSDAPTEIKILDPRGAVRECLILETRHTMEVITDVIKSQTYPQYSISEMHDAMGKLLKDVWALRDKDINGRYDIKEINDNLPGFFHYTIRCVTDILGILTPESMRLWIPILLPATMIKNSKVVDVSPKLSGTINHITSIYHNEQMEDTIFGVDSISEKSYGLLLNIVHAMKTFVRLISGLPTDPNLEEIKRGTTIKERHASVLDYISGEIIKGETRTIDRHKVYLWLRDYIPSDYIDVFLHTISENMPELVEEPARNISIDRAKNDTDINSLGTHFEIVPEGINQIEFISPTCTGEEITKCFTDMKKLTDIVISQKGTTSNRTGLHLSISYNGDTSNFNDLKFLLFSDSYRQILKPEHVRQYVKTISDDLLSISEKIMIESMNTEDDPLSVLLDHVNTLLSRAKTISVNISAMYSSNGRIELRWPGGDGYENRLDEYIDSAIRAMYALEIAYNPSLYQKEYFQSLFRLITKLWKDKFNHEPVTLLPLLKKIKLKYPTVSFAVSSSVIVLSQLNFRYEITPNTDLRKVEQEVYQQIEDTL